MSRTEAPEPGQYSADHLPDGQAVDVDFSYLIHRWFEKGELDGGKRYEFPVIWLANDRTGVSCAIRAALYPVEVPYPIGKAGTAAAVAEWELGEQVIRDVLASFMVHFDDGDCWDALHALVWRLEDGGLSVTQLRPARAPLPMEVSPF